jgi:hypothetical protein
MGTKLSADNALATGIDSIIKRIAKVKLKRLAHARQSGSKKIEASSFNII